jgi:hypothetical protein
MKGIGVSVDKLATRTIKHRTPCDKPDNMKIGTSVKRSKKSINLFFFFYNMFIM